MRVREAFGVKIILISGENIRAKHIIDVGDIVASIVVAVQSGLLHSVCAYFL